MSDDRSVADDTLQRCESPGVAAAPGADGSRRKVDLGGRHFEGPASGRGASACAAIEAHGRSTTCPHCHVTLSGRWGRTRSALQRWRCGSCQRTFCAATATVFSGVHDVGKFVQLLDDMMGESPRSCRALAAALGVDKDTIWRWRRKVALALAAQVGAAPVGPEQAGTASGQLDEEASIVMRESRKASREWVRHTREPVRFPAPDRRRWIDYRLMRLPLPMPMTPHLVTIWMTADAVGSGWAEIAEGEPLAEACRATPEIRDRGTGAETALNSDSALSEPRAAAPLTKHVPRAWTQRAATDQSSVAECALDGSICDGRSMSITVVCSTDIDTPRRSWATSVGTSLSAAFACFLAPFRGPATRHLAGYVGWFLARLPATIEERLARLWVRLMAAETTRFRDMRVS